MNRLRKVIFVAAENGALSGGKVGGVADVVSDLPAALPGEGWAPTVVTPSYGVLHKLPGAKLLCTVPVRFGDARHDVDIWQVPGRFANVQNLVFDHELFAISGAGVIYSNDVPERPFATDASKFAFFCAAVATWIEQLSDLPDIVHLHDWHAAFYCLLRRFSNDHRKLQDVRTVFTIHNVSYQGTRPLRGDDSSLATWFPALQYELELVRDPVQSVCFNPMATAIRLADRVSTVSPTYAAEIAFPSDAEAGFVGGEGLEILLGDTAKDGRLSGILNGCYYDNGESQEPNWFELLAAMSRQVADWRSREPTSDAHVLAANRLARLPSKKPRQVLVSVGRLVSQKATLFIAPVAGGKPALQLIADGLGNDSLLVILGSGEKEFERAILEIAKEADNVLLLQGYSETLAEPLYKLGDLFLMPSSFEPCGISQMLAMRAATPCVVHGVGGLLDTVEDGTTGFVFAGSDLASQASEFVAATQRALLLRDSDPGRWRKICDRAGRRRFDWASSAKATIQYLYEGQHD